MLFRPVASWIKSLLLERDSWYVTEKKSIRINRKFHHFLVSHHVSIILELTFIYQTSISDECETNIGNHTQLDMSEIAGLLLLRNQKLIARTVAWKHNPRSHIINSPFIDSHPSIMCFVIFVYSPGESNREGIWKCGVKLQVWHPTEISFLSWINFHEMLICFLVKFRFKFLMTQFFQAHDIRNCRLKATRKIYFCISGVINFKCFSEWPSFSVMRERGSKKNRN